MTDEEAEASAVMRAGADSVNTFDRMACLAPGGDDGVPVIVLRPGESLHLHKELLRELDSRCEAPRRKTGSTRHQSPGSFCAFVAAYKTDGTTIWVDGQQKQICAVIDYHRGVDAQWCGYRAYLDLGYSEQYKLWVNWSGTWLAQESFAELLEMYYADLASPAGKNNLSEPAAVMNLGLELQVRTKCAFESKVDRRTGRRTLAFREETETGSTEIPAGFLLGIPVFLCSEVAYPIEARLQMRVRENVPEFRFVLLHLDRVVQTAIDDLRAKIAGELPDVPVFQGAPEPLP